MGKKREAETKNNLNLCFIPCSNCGAEVVGYLPPGGYIVYWCSNMCKQQFFSHAYGNLRRIEEITYNQHRDNLKRGKNEQHQD